MELSSSALVATEPSQWPCLPDLIKSDKINGLGSLERAKFLKTKERCYQLGEVHGTIVPCVAGKKVWT